MCGKDHNNSYKDGEVISKGCICINRSNQNLFAAAIELVKLAATYTLAIAPEDDVNIEEDA